LCQTAFWLLVACGLDASDAELLAAYRAAELRAIELVQRRDVWSAIKRVAAELIEKKSLSDGEVRALMWPAVEREAA
jgi:hypothetical protein